MVQCLVLVVKDAQDRQVDFHLVIVHVFGNANQLQVALARRQSVCLVHQLPQLGHLLAKTLLVGRKERLINLELSACNCANADLVPFSLPDETKQKKKKKKRTHLLSKTVMSSCTVTSP